MTKHADEFAEIEAMKVVAHAIKDLDRDAQGRVLTWVTGKYNIQSPDVNPLSSLPMELPSNKKRETEDLPTAFAAASPESDTDRALVGAYWFQVSKGQVDIGFSGSK